MWLTGKGQLMAVPLIIQNRGLSLRSYEDQLDSYRCLWFMFSVLVASFAQFQHDKWAEGVLYVFLS